MAIKYLDSKRLRRILIGGANWLKNHEEYLNQLNVYPVPDGDTGSNMSMTADSMLKDLEELTNNKTSMKDLVEIVEEAVLLGARGNSGTIFSQIITGFLRGTENKKKMYSEDVYLALKEAKEMAYRTVDSPVEGTILTVIKEVSLEAEKIYKHTENLDELIHSIVIKAKETVDNTPEMLPKLKEAGVVDSGALGLYYFFEGIQKTLTEINLFIQTTTEERNFNNKINEYAHDPEDIKFQYCTEFVITRLIKDKSIEDLKNELLEYGDSAVFAETSKKFKTHIHTNNPGNVLEKALEYGQLEKVKIENMKLQVEETQSSSLSNIFVSNAINNSQTAYIAVADTIEMKNTFIELGADVVIFGGQSNNPSAQDFVVAVSKVDENKDVIILPNNKNIYATAKLASDKIDQNVVVVNSRTMLEGYYYLMYKSDSISKLQKEFKNNFSIEITKAVRNTRVNNLEIEIDDYIALVNNSIQLKSSTLEDLFNQIEENYISENTINLVVAEGVNTSEEVNIKIEDYKKKLYGFVDKIKTSQESYNYYILIENRSEDTPRVAIVTDSSSDLTKEDIKDYPIEVVPLKVEIDGITYLEDIDLTKNELWDKLNKAEVVKSSQPSPKLFINAYNKLIRRGVEKIYAINISKGLSGTFQTAKVASNNIKYPDIVTVIDSKLVGIPLGLLCIEVAKKAMNNTPDYQIEEYVRRYTGKTKLFAYMESLDRLHKGGRLSTTSKTFANLLNLKPIITMKEGLLVVEKKVMGENAVFSYIEKQIQEIAKTNSVYVYLTWGGSKKIQEDVYLIANRLKDKPKITVIFDEHILGSAVGVHSGPMLGLFIVPRLM